LLILNSRLIEVEGAGLLREIRLKGDPAGGNAEVGFFTRVKITFLTALAVFFRSENN
jgi:hypothetical protein